MVVCTQEEYGLWCLNQYWVHHWKQISVVKLQQVSASKNVPRVHVLLHRLQHAETHAGHALFHPFLPEFPHWERERETAGSEWSGVCVCDDDDGCCGGGPRSWNTEMFCMMWFMESSRLSESQQRETTAAQSFPALITTVSLYACLSLSMSLTVCLSVSLSVSLAVLLPDFSLTLPLSLYMFLIHLSDSQ